MSPAEFMISVETRTSIKRKTRFPSITEAKAKKFRFDPSIIPEDNTIDQYYGRINEVLPGDRPKIKVTVPFEKTWAGMLDRQDKQDSIISGLVASGEEMKKMMSEMRTTLDEHTVMLKYERKRRLNLCIGNAVIEMARLLFKNNSELKADSSTHR